MSNYKSGDWCQVWDGLYWRWILNHCDQLSKKSQMGDDVFYGDEDERR